MSTHLFHAAHRSLLFTLALAALTILSMAISAPVQAQNRTDLEVTFNTLEIIESERGITVAYEVTRGDWRRLQNAQISPRLDLYLPNRRGTEYTLHSGQILESRTGRLFYRGAALPHRRSEVSLELVGEEKRTHIVSIRLRENRGKQIRVSFGGVEVEAVVETVTETAPQPAPKRRRDSYRRHREQDVIVDQTVVVDQNVVVNEEVYVDYHEEVYVEQDYGPDIIRACQRHTNFASDFDACVARAQQYYGYMAVGVIDACGQHSNFGSDMTRCLDIGLTFVLDPTPSIRACGEATNFASDMHSCMQAAAPAQIDAAPAIRACGQATNFGSDLIRCVERTRN